MAHEKWLVTLEAYLDAELSAQEEQEFLALVEAEEELKNCLDERLAERELYRDLLGEEVPEVTTLPGMTAEKKPAARNFWNHRNLGIGMALAASICLIILVPRLSRDENGAEGPRSPITRSGQVVAVRFGEIPGGTAYLETGAVDFPGGPGR